MLSIIVPVYNCETYLERCLASLVAIDISEKEILLVDDGSTDRSPAILERWAAEHPELRVLHQENAGPSAARNHGLDEARGEYIAFVDSDDWVDVGMFPDFIALMERETDIDICISGTAKDFPDGRERDYFPLPRGRYLHTEKVMDADEALDAMLAKEDFFWFLCGKIYRRALFVGKSAALPLGENLPPRAFDKNKKIHARLDESVATSEDLDLNWILFKRARRIVYRDTYRYHYFMNEDSLTENSKAVKRNKDDLKIYRRLLAGEMSDDCREQLQMRVLQRDYENIREFLADSPASAGGVEAAYRELTETLASYRPTSPRGERMRDALLEIAATEEGCRKSCTDVYDAICEQVRRLAAAGRRVRLFGLSTISRVLATALTSRDVEFDGFVVSEPSRRTKETWQGKPVAVLAELDPAETTVLLTVTEGGQNNIADLLSYHGYEAYEHVLVRPAFTSGI